MRRVAEFEKVSLDTFIRDFYEAHEGSKVSEVLLKQCYEYLPLPKRATSGSAGYDFYLPYGIYLRPHNSIKIVSGYKIRLDEGYVLKLYPRSSLGFKYKLSLDNTVGIIDSDYYNNPRNEGHIIDFLTNHSNETLFLDAGDRYIQGIIEKFYITESDNTTEKRVGGFGSTNIEH